MKGALETGAETGEAVETFLERLIIQNVGIGSVTRASLCLHATDAAQVPGSGKNLVEERLLNLALRIELDVEADGHFVELFFLFRADEDVFRAKAVLARVQGG